MQKPFVFSADSHIVEPNELFLDGLPARLRRHAVHARKEGEHLLTGTEYKAIHRLRVGARDENHVGNIKRLGASRLDGRMEDMARDGVDAEVIFPSLGLYLHAIEDSEAETASCQIYNDWHAKFFSGHLDRFVRCGVLPIQNFADTLAELRRLAGMGFTAAMIPSSIRPGLTKYNDPAWDQVFALAGELGVVLVVHTGTGLESVVSERGPGGAIVNYSSQMTDGINSVMYLVAGGVLDRNPTTKLAVIECGASWLAAIAERMDEVYEAHANFVRPKLTAKPSEIIRRQVHVSFQHDRACIFSRSVTGVGALMFASDYPHSEGTFPITPEVIQGLFEGTGCTEREIVDILGGNAARLFRFNSPRLEAALAQAA